MTREDVEHNLKGPMPRTIPLLLDAIESADSCSYGLGRAWGNVGEVDCCEGCNLRAELLIYLDDLETVIRRIDRAEADRLARWYNDDLVSWADAAIDYDPRWEE